jgi:hypothetical protein
MLTTEQAIAKLIANDGAAFTWQMGTLPANIIADGLISFDPESDLFVHKDAERAQEARERKAIADAERIRNAAPALLSALQWMHDAATSIVDYCGTSWYVLAADKGAAWAGPFGTQADADNARDRLISDAAISANAAIAQARDES